MKAVGQHVGDDLGIQIVIFVPDEITDPADARPIDLGRVRGRERRIDLVEPDRRFADDEKLTFDGAARLGVPQRLLNAAGFADPFLDQPIAREMSGNARTIRSEGIGLIPRNRLRKFQLAHRRDDEIDVQSGESLLQDCLHAPEIDHVQAPPRRNHDVDVARGRGFVSRDRAEYAGMADAARFKRGAQAAERFEGGIPVHGVRLTQFRCES